MTPREWASRYAGLGLRVVPIKPGSKYPVGIGKWQEVASNVPVELNERGWWQGDKHRNDGIGIALGPYGKTGRCLFVVDVDLYKPGVQELWDALLAEHGQLPSTWMSRTPGGGLHVWFWSYLHVTNANGLPEGIDVRGDGGQVLVHPSTHPTADGVYEWVEGHAPHQTKLAHCPEWLAPLLVAEEHIDDAVSEPIPPAPAPAAPPDDFEAAEDRPGDRWAAANDWSDILERDGWTKHHTDKRTGEVHWTRPGKDRREGTSATTGYGTHDVLKVFTTSLAALGLQAEQTYTKMGYVAATRYGGDHSAMASDLAADGWSPPAVDLTDMVDGATVLTDRSVSPALAAMREETTAVAEWPEPRELERNDEPPPWPSDVLPGWMQAQVENIARSVQCPEDLPGMYALGALSVAGLGHVAVEVRRGHVEHCAVWLATPAPPSAGKSPALRMVFAPLHEVEKRAMDQNAQEVAKAEAQRAVLERRCKKLDEAASKVDATKHDEEAAVEARLDLLAIEQPSAGRLMTADATPEKLAILMAQNGESLAIVSDEAGALAFDRYGDKKRGSNLDIYLKAWSGGWVAIDRVNAPPVALDRPLLTIVVGAQPEAWQRALDDDEFRTRGLGARFMHSTPRSRGARVVDLTRDTWDELTARVYDDRLQELAEKWLHWGEAVLTLSEPAKRLWGPWATALGARMVDGADLADEGAWVGKMQDTVLRVAALLHLADGGRNADPIEEGTLRRAMRLGDYWLAHRLNDTGDPLRPAHRLLGTLARLADDEGRVNRLTLAQRGSKGLRNADEVWPLLEALHASWWLRIQVPGMPVLKSGWQRVPGWRVQMRPDIHDRLRTLALPSTQASWTHSGEAPTEVLRNGDDPPPSVDNARALGQVGYIRDFGPSLPLEKALDEEDPVSRPSALVAEDDDEGWALFGGDDA